MKKPGVKPVLLTDAQIEQLRGIQERERQQSVLGIAPSLHDVARKIIDVGLSEAGVAR